MASLLYETTVRVPVGGCRPPKGWPSRTPRRRANFRWLISRRQSWTCWALLSQKGTRGGAVLRGGNWRAGSLAPRPCYAETEAPFLDKPLVSDAGSELPTVGKYVSTTRGNCLIWSGILVRQRICGRPFRNSGKEMHARPGETEAAIRPQQCGKMCISLSKIDGFWRAWGYVGGKKPPDSAKADGHSKFCPI